MVPIVLAWQFLIGPQCHLLFTIAHGVALLQLPAHMSVETQDPLRKTKKQEMSERASTVPHTRHAAPMGWDPKQLLRSPMQRRRAVPVVDGPLTHERSDSDPELMEGREAAGE